MEVLRGVGGAARVVHRLAADVRANRVELRSLTGLRRRRARRADLHVAFGLELHVRRGARRADLYVSLGLALHVVLAAPALLAHGVLPAVGETHLLFEWSPKEF